MADAAKEAGNAAFKAGQYDEAVRHFTAAIEGDASSHVLYSNRSAAYAKQGEFKNALLDGNKCIELAPEWGKGYSRRGAAYVGLRNWRAAKGAYEKGLEVDPSNAAMKAELAAIDARLTPSQGMPSASTSGGAGAGWSGWTPTSVAMPGAAAKSSLLWLAVVLCTFLSFVPLLGMRRGILCYRAAIGCTTVTYLAALARSFPLAFSTLKDPRFASTPEAQFLLVSLLLQLSPPLPFTLVPLACYALHNFCAANQQRLLSAPAFVSTRAAWFTSDEGVATAHSFGAIAELMVCFAAPLTVLTNGSRILLPLFFYAQYLFKRHKSHWYTQTAVRAIHEKLTALLAHRYAAPLAALYSRLVAAITFFASRQ